MKWFKHDSNASTDAKLKKVKLKYGMSGYGLYWHCLELICSDIEKTHITFELEHDAEIIAFDTGINVQVVNEMMAFMIDLELFEQSNGRITCLKMAKRIDQSMTSNPEMRILIDNVRQNHDLVMTESCKTRLDKTRLDKNKHICETKTRFTVPYQKIIDLYHEKLPNNPKVEKLSQKRKTAIKARWLHDLKDLTNWDNYFEHVSKSKFLTGRALPSNGRDKPFVANIDFLTREDIVINTSEGKYHV